MNIGELRSETSRITPAGRAKSAQTTIRGLKLHTESEDAVARVLGEYEEQHQPAGPIEHEMIEMLASYQFLLIRAMAMQTGYLEVAIARHEKVIDAWPRATTPTASSSATPPTSAARVHPEAQGTPGSPDPLQVRIAAVTSRT